MKDGPATARKMKQMVQIITHLEVQLILADGCNSSSCESRSTVKSSRSASLEKEASMAPATVPVAIMGRWVWDDENHAIVAVRFISFSFGIILFAALLLEENL